MHGRIPTLLRGKSYYADIPHFICHFFVTGTSDEHITVVENLRNYNPDGAILVTTPQV